MRGPSGPRDERSTSNVMILNGGRNRSGID
jgi:hypothetical protein